MKLSLHRTVFALSFLITLGSATVGQSVLAQEIPAQQANPGLLTSPGSITGINVIPDAAAADDRTTVKDAGSSGIRVESQPPIVQTDKEVFQVNHVDVQGNTALTNAEIRGIVSSYEGRELNPEDLSTMVSKINEEYRKKGYLTSLAFIPPQDLERGEITIKVLEGMVGEMEITGNKYFKAKVIENRLAENPGDLLNIPKLEKELLQINRTEPYRIKATLSPGERTGETKIHLEVKEQQPFQLALTTDNAGRPYIGMYRYGGELIDRNVSGRGDRFNLRYLTGAGQQLASTSYTLPVGRHGTEVSALFGFSHVNVDLDTRNQPKIIGNGYNYGLLVSQPLDRERTWVLDLGLNARRASSFFNNTKTNTDDIRSATLGLNFNKYDRYGRTFARFQNTFAPDWLGASTHFWKAENFLTRVTRLPKNNLLIVRGYSQFTPNALPPIEQFQLGGVNSVRGYTEGLLIGDRGYNMSAEWRWPIPMLSKVSPWAGERVQGAFFFDYGQTWLDKSNKYFITGVSNSKGRTSLMGTGFGIRARLTDYLQGYADVAFGLSDRRDIEPNAQPTARIHFGVRSELLSNDYKSRTDVVTPIKTDVVRPRNVGMLRQEDLETDISEPTLEAVDNIQHVSDIH